MKLPNAISVEEVKYQLQQVLASPGFRSSPTLSRFLSYIVLETLDEQEQHIKEYSIAVDVLHRSREFNPQDDAVVRIHAGRLRRALTEYYLVEGINDPIIIQIPKGGYIPQFDIRSAGKPPSTIQSVFSDPVINPIVAVFPFRMLPQSADIKTFSLILAEQLSAELSRFQDIAVIGYFTADMMAKIDQNVIEAGKSLGADYIITGSVQHNDQQLRILINFLVTATGEVLMVKSLEKECAVSDMFDMQDEIIQNVTGAIGGYHGVIFQELAKSSPGKVFNNSDIRDAIYIYSKYKRAYSLENYNKAFSTLLQVVKDHPNHAGTWAMLGELYLEGRTLGIMNSADPVTLAFQSVLRSFKIDPLCQHAWYTLTWVHLMKKEKEACLESARQCIQLNPHNSVMVTGVAFMLICAGYFEIGFPIIEKATKSGSYDPLWVNAGVSFYYLHKKEYETALVWAEKMNAIECFWDPLLKSVSLSYLGQKEEAGKCLKQLVTMMPQTSGRLEAMLSTLLLSDELVAKIIRGLKKLGFEEESSSKATLI